jgi:hypothetical protein
VLFGPGRAHAATIIANDLDATGTSRLTGIRSIGMGFVMGPDNYSLSFVYLVNSADSPTLSIYSDNNGLPGSSLFSSFSRTDIHFFEARESFVLQANVAYWLVLSNPAPFAVTGTSALNIRPGLPASFLYYLISTSGPVPTSSIPGFIPPQTTFSVIGDPVQAPPPPPEVPEPSTALLAAGAICLLCLSRARRRSAP